MACDETELPGLARLAERAAANGVTATMLTPGQAREREPYAQCVQALHVQTTGIIDYPGYAEPWLPTWSTQGERCAWASPSTLPNPGARASR